MNSLDAAECEKRLRDPEARAAFLAEAAWAAIPSWSRSAPSTRSAPASSWALSELHGLDMRPLDLIAALDLLLNGPESIPDAWIAGGSPFESARGSDGTDAPGLRALSGRLWTVRSAWHPRP